MILKNLILLTFLFVSSHAYSNSCVDKKIDEFKENCESQPNYSYCKKDESGQVVIEETAIMRTKAERYCESKKEEKKEKEKEKVCESFKEAIDETKEACGGALTSQCLNTAHSCYSCNLQTNNFDDCSGVEGSAEYIKQIQSGKDIDKDVYESYEKIGKTCPVHSEGSFKDLKDEYDKAKEKKEKLKEKEDELSQGILDLEKEINELEAEANTIMTEKKEKLDELMKNWKEKSQQAERENAEIISQLHQKMTELQRKKEQEEIFIKREIRQKHQFKLQELRQKCKEFANEKVQKERNKKLNQWFVAGKAPRTFSSFKNNAHIGSAQSRSNKAAVYHNACWRSNKELRKALKKAYKTNQQQQAVRLRNITSDMMAIQAQINQKANELPETLKNLLDEFTNTKASIESKAKADLDAKSKEIALKQKELFMKKQEFMNLQEEKKKNLREIKMKGDFYALQQSKAGVKNFGQQNLVKTFMDDYYDDGILKKEYKSCGHNAPSNYSTDVSEISNAWEVITESFSEDDEGDGTQ